MGTAITALQGEQKNWSGSSGAQQKLKMFAFINRLLNMTVPLVMPICVLFRQQQAMGQ